MRRLGWAALLAAALALTAVAGQSARSLRIETRLVDVLPAGTPAAEDYRIFLERFGGIEKVFVVVEPAGPRDAEESLLDAAELIAERLGQSRSVASAQAGLSAADERFFLEQVLPRAPLLVADDRAVAERLRPEAVRDRVRQLRRRLRTPGGAAAARWLAADPLGLAEVLAPPAGGVSAPVDPLTGAFVAADGSAALVVVDPAAAELDPQAGRELAAEIAAAVAGAEQELAVELTVHAVGGPLYAAADETIIRADITRTLGGSALAVSLILLFAFRGPRVLLALLATVAVGIVWTAGLAAGLLGAPGGAGGHPGGAALSALAIGFGSILLGLGVDYGIHLAARQREKRLAGLEAGAAVLTAARETAPAILASAATTGGAFLVLALASFRPVRELGLLVGSGVLVLLTTTAAVGAPLLVLGARRRLPRAAGGWAWTGLVAVVERTVRLGGDRPRTVLALAAALALVAAAALPRLEFDADLRSLRPTDHPLQEGEERLAANFGVGLDTATLMIAGDDPQQALDRAAGVTESLRRGLASAAGGTGVGVSVSSPADWLPGTELLARRSRRRGGEPAAAAAAALRAELVAQGMSQVPFAASLAVLDALAERRPPSPVARDLWPDWLSREVATTDDGGALVALRLSAPAGEWAAGPPPWLRSAIERAAPGAPFASFQRLARELRTLLGRDLRRLGGFALLLVAALVLASFRGRPLPAALALLPVSLGLLWTLGACALLGVALDPFSLVVAPVLVGIGIDDGLHALHGARRQVAGSVLEGVREAGPAMALTTLTTAVGFGGLVASRLPALSRGGLLVAGGTLLCLVATLMVIPAADALRRQRRSPTLPPHAPEVGRLALLLGPLRIDGVFWFRLHSWGMRRWPRWALRPTIFLCTVLFWLVLRRIRAAVASNLEAVLGPCGWWERQRRIFRTLHQYAWCLSERYERLTGKPEVEVVLEQPERLEALAGSARGMLFLTGHIGSWETGSAIPVERHGQRVHVVREEETDPRAQAFVAGLLRQAMGEGYVTHFASASDPRLSMALLEALRDGDAVALQGDRPRHGGKTIVRQLFGRPYAFPAGPAVLARAAEVPVVPVFVFRQGRLSYRVHLGEPFTVVRSGDRDADLAAAVQRMATELEAAIRRRPHQWFCFRRLWERSQPVSGAEVVSSVR